MTNATLSETDRICDPNDGFRRCFVSGVPLLASSVEGMRRAVLKRGLPQTLRSIDPMGRWIATSALTE